MAFNTDVGTWRLSTPGGIPYRYKGMTGGISFEDGSASLTYIIRASDLAGFAAEAFPNSYVLGNSIFYPNPVRLPGLPALSAQRLTWKGLVEGLPIDPFGGDPSAPAETYQQFLEVTIEFGTSSENDQERDQNNPFTFLEVSAVASGEFLVSPPRGEPGKAVWTLVGTDAADGVTTEVKEIDVGQKVITSLVEWSLRWQQIPHQWFHSKLLPKLRDSMGKVNSKVMGIFGDAPAETIMFMGYSGDQQFTWRGGYSGVPPIALDMKFVEKNFKHASAGVTVQVTHNHEYRPGVGWRRLKINDENLYDQIDLNDIFGL